MRKHSRSSEYVTSGHADRCCDLIASTIIDAIVKKDGARSHSSIEVCMADDVILVSGEAITTLDMGAQALTPLVWKGLQRAGYNANLRKYFTKDEVLIDEDYTITSKVHRQSPDISLGTDNRCWNDQNISASGAVAGTPNNMPLEHALARDLGEFLFENCVSNGEPVEGTPIMGNDIKILVTIQYEDKQEPKVKHVTVAVPMPSAVHDEQLKEVDKMVRDYLSALSYKLTDDFVIQINGTGRYTKFGSAADSSMTGRKIAVNQMGTRFPLGGGSLAAKSYQHGNPDLYLPLLSRYIAKNAVRAFNLPYCQVEVAVTIGKKHLDNILVTCGDENIEKTIESYVKEKLDTSPDALVERFKILENNNMADICFSNFFGNESLMAWEQTDLVEEMRNYKC